MGETHTILFPEEVLRHADSLHDNCSPIQALAFLDVYLASEGKTQEDVIDWGCDE